ncbi:MAG: YgiQ family radical SAM protein [Crocinitomicaceae bacterium]|nr:YgiQ family radical SAM protein [Crocinitomicaceae bacterium]MDG2464677.1 YgiQ family radical SAM protein [Crocinitomicaceae bacterium]
MDERPITDWLPITKKEADKRGWNDLDVVLISGDAYVDHPSFGTAVVGRIIESEGFKIGIVAQPNWQDDLRDFKKFGKPKYFFGVTAGCMDSMVNHYTANKRLRSTDAYTPGGQAGFRPDYASTAYCKILKEIYPDVPVLLGGIEASLRRVTHYDYWADKLFPSILEDSKADILVYGMGDQPLREILKLLKKGVPFENLRTLKQVAFLQEEGEELPRNKNWETVELSSHEECLEDKIKYAANFKVVEVESNKWQANRITQKIGNRTLVINPPYKTMDEKEIDASFDMPYTRAPHPKYKNRGGIPAFEMIKFSINMHRGCFGGCSFCTISAHQGKFIASRSEESILKEVEQVVADPTFKGYISDLGGPSANMYKMKGKVEAICDRCTSPSCIHPVICSNLDTSHKPMTELYRKVDAHPKVKKAFIGSGIRYDLLVDDFNKNNADGNHDEYIEQVVTRHVSGRLKVAPEHTSDATLRVMRKPSFKYFHKFKEKYEKISEKHGLKQQLIPYFISSHPGCEEQDMANLAAETKDMGFQLEQVQDFTPTPMTVATVIYYAGVHPYTLKPIETVKDKEEKLNQRRFFFWYKRENRDYIRKSLQKANRPELIEKLLDEPQALHSKKPILPNKGNKPIPKWLEERRRNGK